MARISIPYWADSFVHTGTQPRVGSRAAVLVPFLISLTVPLTLGLAITRQSLWTDEGFTVWFASHSSLSSFLQALIGSRGAPGDPQFIFYLLHIWAWIKLFGCSELSLRSANIPFAAIFIYSMTWASQRLFWNRHLWVLFCLSPFFWFYLNEARPYIALLSFASAATVALLAFFVDPERYGKTAPRLCLSALFLAWGAHILAAFLFPTLLILVLAMINSDSKLKSDFLRYWKHPILWCAPLFLLLGGFYIWVSSYGVNKIEGKPGWRNLAFAFYEFAGFAGLGPPRNDIRENPSLPVFLPYWPLLLLGAISLAAVIFFLRRTLQSGIVRYLLISASAGLLIALTLSSFAHFQVLGRHLAVFFPLFLLPVMIGPKRSLRWPSVHRNAIVSVCALGLVWGVSDLRLVLLNKYAKDSYREACSIALSRARQDGAVILWAADPVTAEYYGVTVTPANGAFLDPQPSVPQPSLSDGQAIGVFGWSADQANSYLANSTVPTILVLGKAQPFDTLGVWRGRIREHTPAPIARLNALSIYEWQAGTDARCSACSISSPDELSAEQTSQNDLRQMNLPALGVASRLKAAP